MRWLLLLYLSKSQLHMDRQHFLQKKECLCFHYFAEVSFRNPQQQPSLWVSTRSWIMWSWLRGNITASCVTEQRRRHQKISPEVPKGAWKPVAVTQLTKPFLPPFTSGHSEGHSTGPASLVQPCGHQAYSSHQRLLHHTVTTFTVTPSAPSSCWL